MAPQTQLGKLSTVVAVKDQLSADMKGEAVVLDCKQGVYYSLNEVGATVWNFVQEPRTIAQITEKILNEYDVPAQQWESDLAKLLADLSAAGLIEITHAQD